MQKRTFGPTGVEVPVVGQGTWKLKDPKGAEKALRVGLDLGLTHVDTAELYQGSEEVIARVIHGRRREVFLVSKVRPPNTSYEGTLRSCQGSLQRLNTDRLDVYLQHWWDDERGTADCMRAMTELADEGFVRWIGVSNFTVAQLEEAQSALGRHKIVCNQVWFDLSHRHLEQELLPYLRQKNIALVGYSPFGSTGRLPAANTPPGKGLAVVAGRHKKTPYQVVLNFLASRGDNVFLVPKAETEAHVRDNAGALEFSLTKDDVAQLDAAFPVPENVDELPIM